MGRKPKDEKVQATLDAMKERRTEDSNNLRRMIEIRIKELETEKTKGQDVIDKLCANLEAVKVQMLRIDGAYKVLTQILVSKVEIKPEGLKEE